MRCGADEQRRLLRKGNAGKRSQGSRVDDTLAWIDDVPNHLNAKSVVWLAAVEHIHNVP